MAESTTTVAIKHPERYVQAHTLDGRDLKVKIPKVFESPLRPDLVRAVHTLMAKNKRQPYGVALNAGYQTSASSWGTGRAVSRIPRVPGGGTHRTGQGAFGNMCRGGGMFNPNKTWRRWHRHVNLKEKRFAVASAIASTGVTSLVLARGHRIDKVKSIPLVVSDEISSFTKTKEALNLMKNLGCMDDLQRVANSKSIRCGRGKSRNRRYTFKRGPLVVYCGKENASIEKIFRNIPGVDVCNVDSLNLLKLAPGGTLGRFVIWTAGSFKKLNEFYHGKGGEKGNNGGLKKCNIMNSVMKLPNLDSLVKKEAIKNNLRPRKTPIMKKKITKPNLLKNKLKRFAFHF